MKDVIIVGAGIAGLSAGFELHKENIDFQILELSDRPGGVIETLKIDSYLIETGPHTFSSLSKETLDLIRDLDIEDSLVEANRSAKKRYIYKNGQLIPVPAGPIELFKTDLISKEGKITLLEEFFIKKESKEETVEEFFTRRFGTEVLKNLIQPYLNGVYAGDIKKLSANAVFPYLKELENKYKSILLGLVFSRRFKSSFKKLTLYSFNEGLELLTDTIYERLKNKITLGAKDIEITRAKDFFVVAFKVNNKTINYTANSILFAIPAHKMTEFSHLFPDSFITEVFDIEYLPIATVVQAIDKSKLKFDLDGFGFLCTKEPHRKLLGTIWTSLVFPNRAPQDKALLTSYIGGAHYKKIVDEGEDEVINLVKKEVCETMQFLEQNSLDTIYIKTNPLAIPQYNTGHLEKVKRLEDLMNTSYGLFFTGNYLHGISINDTVKTSKMAVEKVKKFINTTVKKKEVLVMHT